MQLIKHLGVVAVCGLALLACNSGSNTTSSNSQFQPTMITLPSGTTITIPSTNLYVPHNQMLQVPITIVGGNLARGESLMVLASSERQSQDTITSSALQESPNYANTPFTSILPTVISVSPHVTDTIYLDIDDSNGTTGSYSISLAVKDVNTDAIYIHKQKLLYFIVKHTCSTSELQSCNKTNCYAYVNPARTSVNQDGHLQYSAIAMKPDSYDNCFADITQQTVWSSTVENIASIDESGQITPINIGDTFINAGSNTYNINYLWSQSSELTVMPSVPFPEGYGNVSITDLSDVTYSCRNGFNKPIYLMLNNATGILGQVVSGNADLDGYLLHIDHSDIPIRVGENGYGEGLAFFAGYPFVLNITDCQKNKGYPTTIKYGAIINGYKYPYTTVYIKVID